MLPSVVKRLPPAQQRRFEAAYTNRALPIGWGEGDDIAVGLIQAWLAFLGYKLPISVQLDPADNSLKADGIFKRETLEAVRALQRDNHLLDDGKVGHDTLDAFEAALRSRTLVRRNEPVTSRASVTVMPRPYKCPPGALICADPAAP